MLLWLRGVVDRETDLGARVGGAPYVGGAAVAFHPADDAAADALPVLGHLGRVEAASAVADEDLDRGGRGLGVDVDRGGAGVPRRVGDRLAGRQDQWALGVGEGDVAHADDLD